MLRRTPATILVAHRMAPGRRELYVEGVHDRAFINWLTGSERNPDAAVVPVDLVQVEDVREGGNRERLKRFLFEVSGSECNIRGLLDSDHGRILGESLPPNSWSTDLRDAEGYVLGLENIDAAMRLGCGLERVSAQAISAAMTSVAVQLAAFRLASQALGYKLPLSDLRLARYVTVSRDGMLTLKEDKLIVALLNSAGISTKRAPDLKAGVLQAMAMCHHLPPSQVMHGKDCMKLLTLQFKGLGCDISDVTQLLWTSFRRDSLAHFPVLSEVVAFLCKE